MGDAVGVFEAELVFCAWVVFAPVFGGGGWGGGEGVGGWGAAAFAGRAAAGRGGGEVVGHFVAFFSLVA